MKLFTILSLALSVAPSVGVDVQLINTFQPGEEVLVEIPYFEATATVGDEVEFTLFPPSPDDPTTGFYDIDISMDRGEGTMTWTLKDNSGASHLVFPAGSFDRYYAVFPESCRLTSASLTTADIRSEASVPEYEEKTLGPDMFSTGIDFPEVLGNNVLKMFVVNGANLTALEQQIVVTFEYKNDRSLRCRLFGMCK